MDKHPTLESDEEFSPDSLDQIEENRSKFLNNKKLLVTYKYHLDKNDLEEFWRSIIPDIKFFRCAHETSDKTDPYDHTHVLVEFNKPFQSNDCRIFDYEIEEQYESEDEDDNFPKNKVLKKFILIHPNFRKIKTNRHWRNCLYYIAKQDPENADLKFKPNLIIGVQSCNTLKDAICTYARGFSDVNGIIAAYSFKDHYEDMKDCTHLFRRWQIQLNEIISDDPPDNHIVTSDVSKEQWYQTPFKFPNLISRKVFIIWDPIGCTGKTWFCKQLVISNPERYYMFQGCGNSRDVATVVKSGFDSGWKGKVLLINLTRSFAEQKHIYDPLEAIIDGSITVLKYSGKSIMWSPSHIVIFTNWMLDLSKMSHDRYTIYGIHETYKTLFEISLHEAFNIRKREILEKQNIDNKLISCEEK